MTRQFLFLIAMALLFSCKNSNENKYTKPDSKLDTTKNVVQIDHVSILDTIPIIDSSIVNADTTTILGEHYTAIYRNNDYFFVMNAKNDTVFSETELCPYFEFVDFDKDGHKDILFHYISNTPSIQDLILFDKETKKFRRVSDFNNYPAAEKIIGTIYYYSYHRSGCADMNWDSDLFYIKNFKTFRIGNIAGRECNDRDMKNGIYINKVKGEKEILYKTLPITIIGKYKDDKWGFIKEYWTKKHTAFKH